MLVYDYPNTTDAGEWYHSGYINDKITMSRKLTLNVGVRYDRYSSFLPEQGNPGTGPFATKNIYSYTDDFPVYASFVPRVSAVYDLSGEGRMALRASYGRYVGGTSGVLGNPGPVGDRCESERHHHQDLLELGRLDPLCARGGESHLDDAVAATAPSIPRSRDRSSTSTPRVLTWA